MNGELIQRAPPGGALQTEQDNMLGAQNPPPPQEPARQTMPLTSSETVQLQRAFFLSSNDRYDLEQYIMKPLSAPGEDPNTVKADILRLQSKKTLTNSETLDMLRQDGVYCDRDPTLHQKFTDDNVLRLEQRLLREKQYLDAKYGTDKIKEIHNGEYFKINGELKLQNDLLADEITRPADLAFEQSEAYQTREVNSVLSDRMHSFKQRYFRLDINVGKLILQNYPEYFSQEDRLAIQLKELYKEWERRTSLALIPFYMERLRFMEDEQYRREREGISSKEDDEFLRRNIEETHRKLEQEKREVQEVADQLYAQWKAIKKIREDNQYSSTNVRVKVHTNEKTGELYFNIQHEEPSAKKKLGEALPSSEVRRRNNINRIRAFVRLNINGRFVTRSRDARLSWPNLEIEIMEQFQVCVFTMPSSISLEIVVGGLIKDTVVDVIELEIPGSHVKALTSAATIIKELPFSKLLFDSKTLTGSTVGVPKYTPSMTEEQKAAEKKRADKEAEDQRSQDISGVMYVKAEWKGDGPEMPPMRSENVFRQSQPQKVRKNYSEEEQSRLLLKQLYIDVNDPRNERIIKLLKETKNEFLLKLLREDAKNPCASLKPFRHMLLEARSKDPDLAKTPIPLLESEVIQNSLLLDKLELLFREKAYKEYLERKIEEERKGIKVETEQKVYNLDLEDNAIKFDSECIRRRQLFFDKLKHFQREVKSGGHQKAAIQYKSIVREFELLESENPLLALFNKMFITGRKLKPVVQKRQAVSLEHVKDAKILVHVIKGFNVPIRNSAKQDILSKFHAGGGRGPGMMGMGPQGATFGNRSAGPFLTTLNQLGGAQGGFGGQLGITGQGFDPRQSFMAQSAMGGFQNPGNFQTDRMMGVSLSNMNQGRPQMTIQGDIRMLSEDQLRQLYRTHRVEPVIEVRIVYNEAYSEVKITNVAEGDFPEWNEILEFPFSALNKRRFTRLELVNTKSMIYITLYDRETIVTGTGRVEIEQNFRYLGSFSIPLISLLNNPPKIDAIFKVERPLALFNYQVETNSFFFLNQQQPALMEDGVPKAEIPNTYLSMSISLDPILELPQENELEYYIGLEKQNLLAAASEWVKRIKKGKFEKRHIKVYGENVNGQSIMLCRYILPQNPPLDVYDPKKKDVYGIEKAARYVSLIPMIEDNQYFNNVLPDLWCTSQEFLDLGAGDVEEHANLLCNYFNFIDMQEGRGDKYESYVALGIGFPEGRTAYVLRRDKSTNHVELWNPLKGEAYYFGREEQMSTFLCLSLSQGYSLGRRMNDAICQLKSVGCIIGRENVWANVQEYDDPALISFDIDSEKFWKPFLTKNNRNKYFTNGAIASEQSPELRYMKPMDKERADVIAMKIQNYITEQFEAQRIVENRMRTKWNNQMEAVLNSILAKCEMKRKKARQGAINSSLRSNQQVDDDVQQTISDIQTKINTNAKGMKSWGFPINATFISLPMLWEEVKNTKIHLVYDDDAEFSLYVYVEPYSHNVLSVWFYLLALTKDKRRIELAGGVGH